MRKIFTLLLIFVTVFAFGGFRTPVVHLGQTFKPLVETSPVARSVVFKKLNVSVFYDDDYEYCKKYKRMVIAGSVMTGVGVGATIGGAFLFIKALNYNGHDYSRGTGMLIGGLVTNILGAGMTVVGPILIANGATTLKRECKKSDEGQSFYLIPRPTGIGFACRF